MKIGVGDQARGLNDVYSIILKVRHTYFCMCFLEFIMLKLAPSLTHRSGHASSFS